MLNRKEWVNLFPLQCSGAVQEKQTDKQVQTDSWQ
jgi:hypothetical protein